VHDLKFANLCFVLWVQYNAPHDPAAGFLDSGTASVRKRSTKALTKEKYMTFDILSFSARRNSFCTEIKKPKQLETSDQDVDRTITASCGVIIQ
jgi:hypothetical protein